MNSIFQGLYTQLGLPATSASGGATSSGGDGRGVAARVDQAFAVAGGTAGRIEQAFDAASSSTGTSFQYLLATAQRESSLQPDAKAKTSSAQGLFQFIESTWLETLKQAGPSLGLSQYADEITRDGRGRYTVADAGKRKEILGLRNNPEVASLMAGAYTRQNADYLKRRLGRDASAGELYIAHFLGPRGATELIRSADARPKASAADLFPRQAAANRSVFYDKGREKTVSEVYAELTARHGEEAPVTAPGANDRVMTAFEVLGASPHTIWDPALGYAEADASAASTPLSFDDGGWRASAPRGAFSQMFRTDQVAAGAMAAAFWRGFGQMPTLFSAVAGDEALAGDATQDTASSAVLRASQPGQILSGGRQHGPLDLSAFLKSSG